LQKKTSLDREVFCYRFDYLMLFTSRRRLGGGGVFCHCLSGSGISGG
jgi:hypothetical protein